MTLTRPKTQKEFKQGYDAYRAKKRKDENPYANWMRKGAEIKQIYWAMGWDAAKEANNAN